METPGTLRAEVQRLRVFALTVMDSATLAEIQELIDELELRARKLGNGHGAVVT